MAEDLNAEIAGSLAESKDAHTQPAKSGWEERVEIPEALLLAVVAVATAWSGYKAARWDGRQAEPYGEASTIRMMRTSN